mgnify:CR=1 FL=1
MAKHEGGLAIQQRPCDTNPLTQDEALVCGQLLARSRPLPRRNWEILKVEWEHRLAPFDPVVLVILERPLEVMDNGEPINVIFRKRSGDPSKGEAWAGAYHFAGSYLGGGESVAHAIQRILTAEISANAILATSRLITTTNLPCMIRNHDVSLVFLVTLVNFQVPFSEGVSLHRLDKPPQPLIPHHVWLHQRVMRWIKLYRRLKQVLPPDLFQEFLDTTNILESDVE